MYTRNFRKTAPYWTLFAFVIFRIIFRRFYKRRFKEKCIILLPKKWRYEICQAATTFMTHIDVKVFQRFQKYKPVTDKQLNGQLRLTNTVKFHPFTL